MSTRFYFTFGSADHFPYQNTYLVIVASDYRDAVEAFKKKHPNVNPNCINCSDYYSEKEWEEVGKLYADRNPAEIIWTDNCYGKKPDGFNDLFVFAPEKKQIIHISEGSGDNLLAEDIEDGYVDYVYYEQYDLDDGISEADGGEMMTKELVKDKYQCLADCIPDVLEMAYGSPLMDCMILA